MSEGAGRIQRFLRPPFAARGWRVGGGAVGPEPLAVVLSAGTTKVAYHAGFIQALAAAEIVPDLVVGTSGGAWVGAAWSWLARTSSGGVNPEAGARIKTLMDDLNRHDLIPSSVIVALVRAVRNGYVMDLEPLLRALFSQIGVPPDLNIEDLPIPFIATDTDALTGARGDIASGPLLPALLASAAQPAIFRSPVRGGRRWDGALSNYLNLAATHGRHAGVLAIDLSKEEEKIPDHGLGHVRKAFEHLLRDQANREYLLHRDCCRVVYVRPELPDVKHGDFSQTDALYRLGLQHGERVVERHRLHEKRLVPGRFWPRLRGGVEGPPDDPPAPPAVARRSPLRRFRPPGSMEPSSLAVVLSGDADARSFGTVRVAYHAGVAGSLARRGIVPGLIVGTGRGAWVGALWSWLAWNSDGGGSLRRVNEHAGYRIKELVHRADHADQMPRNLLFAVVRGLAQGYVVDLEPVLHDIFEGAGIPLDQRIEDMPVPFIATATDVLTGECVDIGAGPLLPALLASSAQPPVFRAPRIEGRVVYDGAISGCLNLAAAHGKATQVIGVDLSAQRGPARATPYDDLAQAMELLLRRQADQEYRLHARCCHVVRLRPELPRVEPKRSDQIDTMYELGSAHCDLVRRTRGHGLAAGIYAPQIRGAGPGQPLMQRDEHDLPVGEWQGSIGFG